ncbi:MAG: 30S ribosomal protein S12 methylthiotransferase RimO [Acidobacteria bacterium]|nr:MAG: 30S ribosomal protein S12 methylthiotransferase RimO [Acidobacteriota bacterium]
MEDGMAGGTGAERRGGDGGPITVGVVNLGCPKNQVDAEVMLGQLAAAGYRIAESPEEAELVIVNTCGFIQEAKEESIQSILAAAELKRRGRCRALVVSGCLPQRYAAELPGLLPEVDAFLGTGEFARIGEIARTALATPGRDRVWITARTALPTADLPRRRLTPPHVAYVKVAEGCDHTCSFCAIPGIRGRLQSRPRADVAAEVRRLAAEGVREVILVAQDTTAYGWDRGEPRALVRLLEELLQVPGLAWIRLHYLYPTRIPRELVRLLAAEPRLCRYLDLPLQHCDGRILHAMRRGGHETSLRRLVDGLRAAVPDLVIRTSFITGFPGEGREEFAALHRFLEEMRFDRVGVFCYSDEEGTGAVALKPKVPARIAEARRAKLMAVQARIAEERGRALIGSVQEVLVDGPSPQFPELMAARMAGQTFEVDGCVYVRGPAPPAGRFVQVRIREAFEHDFVGEVVEVPQ